METVGDVMESIRDIKKLIEFINGKLIDAEQARDTHGADSFGDVALALGDYISALKRMKLKEEI